MKLLKIADFGAIMKRFIDLFSGIGGFRVALEKKGMDCVFSSEIDRHCREVYKRNFGDSPAGDITAIQAKDIPSHDILCAGFPCQSFSLSGKSRGFSDPRGRLFFEIVRIAKYHKPPVLLLENVKNIITIDNGHVMKNIYSALEKIGYKIQHYKLNSSLFGVPQRRERVYFVCLREDQRLQHSDEIKPTYRKKFLQDILLSDEECEHLVIERKDMNLTKKHVNEKALRPIQIGYVNKGGQGERIYSPLGHAITQAASSGGVGQRTGLYYINNKLRRLHIDEAKTVMGFRKGHHVSDGLSGYSQLGNAVIPSMVSKIYDSIKVAA